MLIPSVNKLWYAPFRQFCTEPEYFQEHEDLPLYDLDRLLRNFIVILKKPDQTEYKPSTVKNFTSKYTIPDPGYQWESNKLKIRHHKREPRGQPFPRR